MTTIVQYTFYQSGLTTITIPSTVSVIENYAFDFCTALSQVTFNNGLLSIGEYAFRQSALTSVVIPDSVTTIDENAFRDSSLTAVTLGSGLTTIGGSAFWSTDLTSVVFPNSVTFIGNNAFFLCNKLLQVTFGTGLTEIGSNAFANSKITNTITIPDSVVTVGNSAFGNNKIDCVHWKDYAGNEARVFPTNPLAGCPPTLQPSLSPSNIPTAVPSAPTADPSMEPSMHPSADPSISPSVNPTLSPSAAPFVAPTATPTEAPSVRPTVPAVKNYELVVDVEQGLYNVTMADYNAQQAACNSTIQHTITDIVDGVTPERVTDIIIEEEEEEGGRIAHHHGVSTAVNVVAVTSVRLKYKITVNDPLLTMSVLRAQLVQAAQDGTMDARLRVNAAQFGATGLNNGTFAVPQVTNAAAQRDSSSQLTGVMIALLVIGAILALLILVVAILYAYREKPARATAQYKGAEMYA